MDVRVRVRMRVRVRVRVHVHVIYENILIHISNNSMS